MYWFYVGFNAFKILKGFELTCIAYLSYKVFILISIKVEPELYIG